MRLMMRGVKADPVPDRPEAPPSIDLSVNFEFGSARLTSDAVIVLDNLGRALNDPDLKAYRFIIAGHTDGVGSDAVNLRLSEARAHSVTQYLAHKHGVAPERLTAKGFGFRQLLYPNDPANALNRRVQITTLVPGS
jgi:outer membrane protein OmpA-like peptidoglycan-associated protein